MPIHVDYDAQNGLSAADCRNLAKLKAYGIDFAMREAVPQAAPVEAPVPVSEPEPVAAPPVQEPVAETPHPVQTMPAAPPKASAITEKNGKHFKFHVSAAQMDRVTDDIETTLADDGDITPFTVAFLTVLHANRNGRSMSAEEITAAMSQLLGTSVKVKVLGPILLCLNNILRDVGSYTRSLLPGGVTPSRLLLHLVPRSKDEQRIRYELTGPGRRALCRIFMGHRTVAWKVKPTIVSEVESIPAPPVYNGARFPNGNA